MAYQAIYRKWRPQVFEDIIGQSHITTTLKNQIMNDRISHAYLFCGTRGTGKTTAAKVFAKAVNCLNPKNGSPCNECEICRGIQNGSILDVTEIDAASNNSVDNIRDLREDVNYVAARTKYRVYIIDEVHMLTTGAFNALLKTLEEPPAHVIFILATTEVHKIPETILSRCQRFDFRRITPNDIIVRMKEIAAADGINITDDAYELLAQMADGSMRDGLSILERCVSACGTNLDRDSVTSVLGIAKSDLLFRLGSAVIENDSERVLNLIDTVTRDGKDLNVFCDSVIKHFRDLLVCKITHDPKSMIEYSDDLLVKLKSQAQKATFEKLSHAVAVLTKAKSDAKWVKNPRVIYELALLKLTRPELDSSEEALLDRLSAVEEAAKNGITVIEQQPEKEQKEEKKEDKKKDEVSARLFVPIAPGTLSSSSPVVIAAKNWGKYAAAIGRDCPYLISVVSSCGVTVDGEGLLLLFKENEKALKDIAVRYLDRLQESFAKHSRTSFKIKIAFEKDVEDAVIDIYKLPDRVQNPAADVPEVNDKFAVNDDESDPLEAITSEFPDVVKLKANAVESSDAKTESSVQQGMFDNDENEDREEFLDDAEMDKSE
mgnify:FL=1